MAHVTDQTQSQTKLHSAATMSVKRINANGRKTIERQSNDQSPTNDDTSLLVLMMASLLTGSVNALRSTFSAQCSASFARTPAGT